MKNHQLAVFGDVDVTFKTVGSGLFHCHPEGQRAVLRVIAGKIRGAQAKVGVSYDSLLTRNNKSA